MMKLPLILHACSTGYQKPVPGNFEIPKQTYVSRFYEPPGGGGVTTIYEGTGCAIFGVPFFQQKINFGVPFLVKSQVVINFGVSF